VTNDTLCEREREREREGGERERETEERATKTYHSILEKRINT